MERKLRFYGELKFYGEQRGYKAGWASNQYREKFGVWPVHNAIPCYPQPDTVSWIKSRMIRWIEGKKKGEARV
jgi:DNA repair protein RadD